MNNAATPATLTIETGRRTWNLDIIARDGKLVWLVSTSGKTYLLDLGTGLMKGLNRKKNAKATRRSYDWTVSNITPLRRKLGYRRPSLSEMRAAA